MPRVSHEALPIGGIALEKVRDEVRAKAS